MASITHSEEGKTIPYNPHPRIETFVNKDGSVDEVDFDSRSIITYAADPTGKNQHEKGAKLDAGKPDWSLLPLGVLEGVVEVLTYGKNKYTRDGWKEVPEAHERYFSAMMRHWLAVERGEVIDEESGINHAYHFLTNAMFLTHFATKELRNDSV